MASEVRCKLFWRLAAAVPLKKGVQQQIRQSLARLTNGRRYSRNRIQRPKYRSLCLIDARLATDVLQYRGARRAGWHTPVPSRLDQAHFLAPASILVCSSEPIRFNGSLVDKLSQNFAGEDIGTNMNE